MATNDPRALLRRLLQETSERDWLEFKHNNTDPEEIGRCVSACANASMLAAKERAFMVWGIQDLAKNKLGTSVRLNLLKRGGESFTNWLSRLIKPPIVMEFLDFEDDGKAFSILTIDPSYDRPVSFAGVEYIRVGENIKALKEFPEHERSLWLATGRRRFEGAIARPHQSAQAVMGALDVDAFYRLSRQPRPNDISEQMRNLMDMEFVLDDWESGYNISNLGAIMFAKDITKFPSIISKAIRVIRYSGKDKRSAEGETEWKEGYAVGFSSLMKSIMDMLPTEEKYDDGVRRSQPAYSEIAIREILANALIHQDFTISGSGPFIEIYKDRVEITNPGNSLIEKNRIINERRSRNEKLARAMRSLGLCEERGGGIDKAILDIEQRYLPTPGVFMSKDSMRVVLFGPKQFNELSKYHKRWSCLCHCVVKWIGEDYMSNTTLRERFALGPEHYQLVSAVIADAKRAGEIMPADPNQGKRNARYVPAWVGDRA